jgi:hypothetical protein
MDFFWHWNKAENSFVVFPENVHHGKRQQPLDKQAVIFSFLYSLTVE